MRGEGGAGGHGHCDALLLRCLALELLHRLRGRYSRCTTPLHAHMHKCHTHSCSNLTSRSFLFGARESGETSSSLHSGHVNSVSSRCSLMPAGGGRGGRGGRAFMAYVIRPSPNLY